MFFVTRHLKYKKHYLIKRTFILHIRLGIKNDCSNHYNFTFTKKATDTNNNLKLGLNQNELLNSNVYQWLSPP